MTANRDYEKTLRWISQEIKRYDKDWLDIPQGERAIRTLDLLSTIKLCCDIDTGEIEVINIRKS
mgnify:CR=1 FL=1|tara:strand:+ start:659 stop:850 length:192 start_codon:yes stop_codon:yes gene_type:complete